MNPFLDMSAPSRLARRLVLGTAFLLGLAVALSIQTPSVRAQDAKAPPPAAAPKAPPSKSVTITDGPKSVTITGGGNRSKVEIKDGTQPGAQEPADAEAEATPPARRSGKRARIEIDGLGDREYDSFDEFIHNEPQVAGMIIAIVAVVFLAPVLAIALILWYRMRKARMLNETMLKLAERGIVSPDDALAALGGNRSMAATVAAAQTSPGYEQVRYLRRRAAWSDLRKGVITGGIGLALTLYSLFDDRSPNGLGLVLLFVGAGFVVLWYFEERQLAPPPLPSLDPGRDARAASSPPAAPPPAA